MKKILLSLSAFALTIATSMSAQAQQHLTLYEEFTGENCPPCAAANPDLWDMVTAPGNESKILMIKYQNDIPSWSNTDGIYKSTLTNTNLVTARKSYYGNSFSPQGFHNGYKYGGTYPGHVAYLSQTRIDSMSAGAAKLNVEVVSFKFSKNNDSITAVVKVTAPAAYAPSGASLKLRGAFIQTLNYSKSPDNTSTPPGKCGTNGEKEFENVVRQMLPDANGTSIPNSWTANQTQTFTLSAKLLPHVTLAKHDETPFFAAWVQNDATKDVIIAARSQGNDFPTAINTVENGINDVNVYPNPATNYAVVSMNLAKSSAIHLTIMDAVGHLVYSQSEANFEAGKHEVTISTQGLAAGVYTVTVHTAFGNVTRNLSIQ